MTTKDKQREGSGKPSTKSTRVELGYVRRAVDLSELTRSSSGAANNAPAQKKLPPAPGRVPSNNAPVPLKDVLNPKQRRQD